MACMVRSGRRASLHWGVDPHGYMYVWRYSMEEYRIEVSHPSSLVGSPLGAMPSAETLEVVPLPTGGAAARKDPVERGKEPMNSQRPAAKLGANSEKSVPEDSKSGPFVLGEGLPILPAKLTAKILRGEFVEMHELLQDNIALDKKVADELTTLNQGTKQSKKRELTEDVHGLLSWVECQVQLVLLGAPIQISQTAPQGTHCLSNDDCTGSAPIWLPWLASI